MAGFGYYAQTQPTRSGLFWRSAGLAFAFLIAQLGFLMGLWKVVCGQKIFSYRNIG